MIRIDKVFVIAFTGNNSVKKKLFQARLKSIPLPSKTPIEILEVPEKELINDALSKYRLRLYSKWALNGYQAMSPEEIDLAIGHWKTWQKARVEKHQSILVLEEGFLPAAQHYSILNPKEPWEMIYLGRDAIGGDISAETEGLVSPGYSKGSFAYVINGSGIRKILKSGYDQNLIPVGEFLSAMHGAHPREDVSALFSIPIAALAPMKNFIEFDKLWPVAVEKAGRLAKGYKPLHPQLFNASGNQELQWVKKYLDPQLVRQEFDLICDEPIDNIYSFPLFTPLFCKQLIEEAEHYGHWTSYRNNDSPPIDILLSSMGFNEIYTGMLKKYLYPLFYHRYQLTGEGWKNMGSQNFIVRYLHDQQAHLGLHNDGSYLSMVVTLNTDHEGGGTYFPKFKKLIKHTNPGQATIHPGLVGYLHGARPVTKGRRYILASFFFPGDYHPLKKGMY